MMEPMELPNGWTITEATHSPLCTGCFYAALNAIGIVEYAGDCEKTSAHGELGQHAATATREVTR